MSEEWKVILETNGLYEVSNYGRVRNTKTGTVRKARAFPNGYFAIHYHLNGKNKIRYIHRLVAEAFCNHPVNCDIVNHLDNNKHNNRFDNLEWTTQFENVHHGMRQNHYRLQAVPVVGYKDGNRYEFASANDAMKKTGCDNSGILKCCKGLQQQSKGYRWEFAEVI